MNSGGCSPGTRMIAFVVGDPYKPSCVTATKRVFASQGIVMDGLGICLESFPKSEHGVSKLWLLQV